MARLGERLQRVIGEYVGLEEIDDGVWDVYFGPLRLGRLHDRLMRIEDAYGRLRRHSPRRTTEENEGNYNATR